MEALQEWIEEERFITTCDFSTKDEESTLYHSHSMKNKPYLSLKEYYKWKVWKTQRKTKYLNEMVEWAIYRILILHLLASRAPSFAMASWGSFAIGFVPRQLWEAKPP